MKRLRITETDITRLVKKIVSEDSKKEDPTVSFMWKIKKRLKGISDDQLDYNMRNDLPWDWKGTKEGFYEKMEPKGKNSGSN
jgi:hypothetical protein